MNPCPCGFYGDPVRQCRCQSSAIQRYQKRISGPLLDRIDIHIEVPRVKYEKLAEKRGGELGGDSGTGHLVRGGSRSATLEQVCIRMQTWDRRSWQHMSCSTTLRRA